MASFPLGILTKHANFMYQSIELLNWYYIVIWLTANQLTDFYMRATLALNGLSELAIKIKGQKNTSVHQSPSYADGYVSRRLWRNILYKKWQIIVVFNCVKNNLITLTGIRKIKITMPSQPVVKKEMALKHQNVFVK